MASRLGVIDIGSNAIRMAIADASTLEVLETDRVLTRLGARCGDRLDADAAQATVAAVEQFLERMGDLPIRVLATAAVRDAEDGAAFADQLSARIELPVEVLSARQEGALALRAASQCFDLTGRCAVVDIGGASTEVVIAFDGSLKDVYSRPIGAVTLPEGEDPGDQFSEINPVDRVVGMGGTFTTLSRMAGAADAHGAIVTRAAIEQAWQGLCALDVPDRATLPGVGKRRAEIIVPGVSIARAVLDALGAEDVTVHAMGIRLGALVDMSEG